MSPFPAPPPTTVICISELELTGMIIGPGGKTHQRYHRRNGAKIDIEDSGRDYFRADFAKESQTARQIIQTCKLNAGTFTSGESRGLFPIGAFVEFLPGKEE